MKQKEIRSDIAWATPKQVVIHGLDLCEDIVGKLDFGQMAFLQIFGRMPEQNELRMFNAMMVILVEHGITPSSLATRMTYCGAPESVQAAVAAGLLGLGSVFVGSLDNAARLLQESLPEGNDADLDISALASEIVASYRSRKEIIPGIGHPFHKPIDPRTPALFKVARETGFDGPYIRLMEALGREAERQANRALPVNVTGAMAAVASEMGISWRICRGLAVAARSVGLVGHILEEMRQPMAETLYLRIEHEAGAHLRPADQS
ncbi:citryl-CoA lyase [Cupriavidus oxalaticus]|jgi:citrate synthase|uniref:citrate synthase (unknown stereospecificity) n=1 Tax=Cupriavidus oxalaticus TaxID=96344 RepID=A0A375G3X6_9BURK|nr:citryl-CoA lyase [Cupriavidus oxalaticus]QEZ46612.1 citryl-CoA lyase [Cupriavidus oxalaticus]QRQ89067.1 citryl-CoA lyase [Cupriavidus oxalaticus]QRQ95858.1 citryl-CoA lyase [Cupriavidus oxalaticus]WQD84535.1 citryl-CoA lyase [Cupriavidus oxalaticus]SPC06535.1 Citrate synthase [Cupriavidus oxalaticus]